VDDVFREVGSKIGPWLSSLPDGEVGERLSWTGYLPDHVYSNCADLERVSKPDYDTQSQPPTHDHHWQASKIDLSQVDSFRIRDGVTELRFGDLYVGDVAIESYQRFTRLREEALLPAHLRFQVCLPGTSSAIEEHFSDPADWPRAKRAYRAAIGEELQRIQEAIPPHDLTVQFDCAWEVVDLSLGAAPMFPWSPPRTLDEKYATHVIGMSELVRSVGDGVVVGAHWCYGTWGGWPMNEMTDLGLCVELTARAVYACGGRLDYVHMPVAEDADATFFAPLEKLGDTGCKVYLGLLHTADGVPGFERRWALARGWLPDAGVAAVCGFGREGSSVVPGALRLHREAGLALAEERSSPDG
jgi:hypothetical protein